MKKGVSEFVFKAIFVTVAGSLIMVFLFKFAFEQVDIFGKVDVRELVVNLDHQLEALSVVPNSNRVLNLGRDYELIFDCDSISSKDYTREIEHIVFASGRLEGDKIQAWTRTWKFPFKITNFYYLANDKISFVLVYDKNNYDVVKNLKIPGIFDAQYINVNKMDFKKIRASTSESDMVVFVFFNKINNNNEVKKNIPNSRTIYVDYTNNNLKFFDKNIESFYLGEEMLIGAIFNPDNYECVKERALGKLGNLSVLYKTKSNFLLLKEPREDCRSKLVSMAGTLDAFTKQKTKASLYETKTNIEKQNDMLEKNGCAKTY